MFAKDRGAVKIYDSSERMAAASKEVARSKDFGVARHGVREFFAKQALGERHRKTVLDVGDVRGGGEPSLVGAGAGVERKHGRMPFYGFLPASVMLVKPLK